MTLMRHPLVYELNTRTWLQEHSLQAGRRLTLNQVPEAELVSWQRHGFSHVWLMGVWTTGPKTRRFSRGNAHVQQRRRELLPAGTDDDIVGSPYAVAEYVVAPEFGGDEALRLLRRRLAERGIKLILDFVPNHVGLDHPWLAEHPEYLVHDSAPFPGAFPHSTPRGTTWFAHGRDPYFPPWEDTVQVEIRHPGARRSLARAMSSVAARCDGIRCDMAMLLLNDVFARTWAGVPSPNERSGNLEGSLSRPMSPADRAREAAEVWATGEFWAETIRLVKEEHPDCLLMAEVYWNLEGRLQELGFDVTYDKEWYDAWIRRQPAEFMERRRHGSAGFAERCVHFLENHDESRVASMLSWPEHRAAVVLMLGLPGVRLLHEGQLAGARLRASVHLGRQAPEAPDAEIQNFYEQLLEVLRKTGVGRADWNFLPVHPLQAFAIQWSSGGGRADVVLVNLSAERALARWKPKWAGSWDGGWHAGDLFHTSGESSGRIPRRFEGEATFDLAPWEARVIRVEAGGSDFHSGIL